MPFPQVTATCKHFAAYSLEAADGYTRNSFNAVVSERCNSLCSHITLAYSDELSCHGEACNNAVQTFASKEQHAG